MGITVDGLRSRIHSNSSEQLPDDTLAHKVNNLNTVRTLSAPILGNNSLNGKVTNDRAVDPAHLRAVDAELAKPEENSNYRIRVQFLIGEILALFSQISKNERGQKKNLEATFTQSSKQWGVLQKEMGDRGFHVTWIGLALMAGQFLVPQADAPFLKFLSEQGCSNISNMMNSKTQSEQKVVDSVSSLAMAEINAMMNKNSSDAQSKEKYIALLDEIYQALKRAAQSQ